MAVNPCVLTNVLANDYYKAVTLINRKFNSLKRLAELLEQLGDISGLLPNISALIPLYLINLDAYTNLVTACPFLNLPKSPSNTDIANLQGMVASAYSKLISGLLNHPWARMGALQSQLDKAQHSVDQILNQGTQFFQCLQQACASADSAVTFVSDIAKTDFQGQVDDYTRTYLANNGKVLTTGAQGKVDTINGAINNVNELMSPAPLASPPAKPIISPVPSVPQIPSPPAKPRP